MAQNLKEVKDFPMYCVSDKGEVFRNNYGRLRRVKAFPNGQGAMKVTLSMHNQLYTKSVAKLVAQAFVWNDHDPEIWNTPIHLDNNLENNSAANLRWRPRWFALKYQRQWRNPEYRFATTMVQDTKTLEVYNILEACQHFGVLLVDVMNSCTSGEDVFPTNRNFVFV